jgi:hypothetical protein
MLSCMNRRHVLFYLLLALEADDELKRADWLRHAQEFCPESSPTRGDIEALRTMPARHVADEIDALMGMLEIEQAVAAQDRGARHCAATRYLHRCAQEKSPRQTAF